MTGETYLFHWRDDSSTRRGHVFFTYNQHSRLGVVLHDFWHLWSSNGRRNLLYRNCFQRLRLSILNLIAVTFWWKGVEESRSSFLLDSSINYSGIFLDFFVLGPTKLLPLLSILFLEAGSDTSIPITHSCGLAAGSIAMEFLRKCVQGSRRSRVADESASLADDRSGRLAGGHTDC